MQNIYLRQSLELASLVQDQFTSRADRTDRGVKQGPFLVLWMTTMPSILIETGFITNTAEEKFLKSERILKTSSALLLIATILLS